MKEIISQYIENGILSSSIEYLRHHNLYNDIQNQKNGTGVCGCHYWDYVLLHKYILEKKPKTIIEFGSGTTTIVMAKAMLSAGYKGLIISYDNDYDWNSRAILSTPGYLRLMISYRYSKAELQTWNGIQGVCYQSDLYTELNPDLVFCDGPPLEFPYPDGKRYPNLDLLKLIESTEKPLDALIDGRIETCAAVQQFIGDKIHYDPILKLGIIEQVSRNDLKIPNPLVA